MPKIKAKTEALCFIETAELHDPIITAMKSLRPLLANFACRRHPFGKKIFAISALKFWGILLIPGYTFQVFGFNAKSNGRESIKYAKNGIKINCIFNTIRTYPIRILPYNYY
jgi:hypothetical protein